MTTPTSSWRPPDGAWDCHTHVFGPPDQFPTNVPSIYPLPNTPYPAHRAAAEAAGLAKAVLIQPAPYGQDVSVLVSALEASGGNLRGIGSATGDVADNELEAMNRAGVRGLRFLEAKTPAGEYYPGSVQIDQLELLAPRMKALGWHAEIWSILDDLFDFWPRIKGLRVPVVLDHMGGFDARRGVDDAAFQRLLALVSDGEVWVKLTLCRRAPFGSDFSELRPFHDALIRANPERMLWGSDWPFVRMGEHAPTTPALVDLFGRWVDDEAMRRQILVDNPTIRYQSGP